MLSRRTPFSVIMIVLGVTSCWAQASGGVGNPNQGTPAAKATFSLYDNYDLSGSALRDVTGADLAKCQEACDADTQCVAYSFAKWAGACRLRKEAESFRFDARGVSGIKAGTRQPAASDRALLMQCPGPGNAIADGKPRTNSRAARLEDCEHTCEVDADCVAFDFTSVGENACRTFTSVSKTAADPMRQLGFKSQLIAGDDGSRAKLCPSPASVEADAIFAAPSVDRTLLDRAIALCTSAGTCPTDTRTRLQSRVDAFSGEETTFQAAQDDAGALQRYLVACKICAFRSEAQAKLASLEQADERQKEKERLAAEAASKLGMAVAIGNVAGGRAAAYVSRNDPDEDAARTAALELCRSKASDCKAASASGRGCIAAAGIGRVWAVRGAATEDEARRSAVAACGHLAKRCVVFARVCSAL